MLIIGATGFGMWAAFMLGIWLRSITMHALAAETARKTWNEAAKVAAKYADDAVLGAPGGTLLYGLGASQCANEIAIELRSKASLWR